MEDAIKRCVSVAAAIIFSFSGSYCKRVEHSSAGLQIMTGTPDLGHRKPKVLLARITTIERDWFDYGSVFVDKEGYIIYWQERDGIIAKFDINGNQILKKKLPSGQGPGDVRFFDFDDYGGRYYAWDKGNRRLNTFDRQFGFQLSSDIVTGSEEGRYNIRFDGQGNLYFIFELITLPKAGNYAVYADVGIGAYGRDGKIINNTFFKERYCAFMGKPDGRHISYFFMQPFLRYAIDDKDNVWICDRRDYIIYKYSPARHLENIIKREFNRIPVKGQVEAYFREEHRLKAGESSNGIEHALPEYIYPLMDILLLDGGYILVLRMDNMGREDKRGKILADLFSARGEFLTGLELPEFVGSYNLNNQFKSNICYRGGRLATLESDNKLEKFRICSYELRVE